LDIFSSGSGLGVATCFSVHSTTAEPSSTTEAVIIIKWLVLLRYSRIEIRYIKGIAAR
jgi:hypothetical protein